MFSKNVYTDHGANIPPSQISSCKGSEWGFAPFMMGDKVGSLHSSSYYSEEIPPAMVSIVQERECRKFDCCYSFSVSAMFRPRETLQGCFHYLSLNSGVLFHSLFCSHGKPKSLVWIVALNDFLLLIIQASLRSKKVIWKL